MHELSLCSSIAETVTAHAGGRRVRTINLRIGHLRQVVPDTLQFCWSMQSSTSPLSQARLEIEHVPAVVWCAGCGHDTVLEHPIPICGSCGTADVELTSGEEFVISSIDLVPDDAEPDDAEPDDADGDRVLDHDRRAATSGHTEGRT